jgi:hypothetical protein
MSRKFILCRQSFLKTSKSSSKIRIEEVFGKNPKIQKILGCDTQFVDPRTYCEFGPRSPAPPGGM